MIAFVVHNHSLSDWLTKRRAVCQTIRSKTTNFHDVRLIFPRYAWAVRIYMYNHRQKSWENGGGGGRENCEKISKRMHCFMREPINYTENYKYCSTLTIE